MRPSFQPGATSARTCAICGILFLARLVSYLGPALPIGPRLQPRERSNMGIGDLDLAVPPRAVGVAIACDEESEVPRP